MNEPMPVVQADTSKRRTPVIVASIIGVVVLLALGAYVFTRLPLSERISALTLPKELRDASFVSVANSKLGPVYRADIFSFKATEAQGELATLTRDDGRDLAVYFDRTTKKFSLQIDGQVMASSSTFIDSPSRAPKGLALAYARPHGTSSLEQLKRLSPDGVRVAPSAWEGVVYYPLLNREDVLGVGYAPLFVSDTTVLLFAPSGIYRIDMASGTTERVLERAFPMILDSVKQSPDRTLVAFTDAVNQTTYVYRVGDSLEEIMQVTGISRSYALGNDALYAVRKLSSGTEIWRYGLDGGAAALIHTLPASLSIGQLAL